MAKITVFQGYQGDKPPAIPRPNHPVDPQIVNVQDGVPVAYPNCHGVGVRVVHPVNLKASAKNLGLVMFYLPPHVVLQPGSHETEETYCILEGQGRMTFANFQRDVQKGDFVYLSPWCMREIALELARQGADVVLHLYPDYNPCLLMGGEKALREGIARAHARGKRIVLYANGQLIERGTAYWTETGQHLAVTKKDGINPDFVIMTEGFFDALLDSIAYFHGCSFGVFKDSADQIAGQHDEPLANGIFPEMVRYTYPEVACTIRFPAPLVSRSMANYACVYGWRLEIESRYTPDRDYLLNGRIPTVEDYGQVLDKPDVALMQTVPYREGAEYMRCVAKFQKRNAPLLMTGTFADTEGFTCKGSGIVAKGFRSGNLLGVILWNTSNRPSVFTIGVPESECLSASEPGKDEVKAFSPLAPQSIRLLVWKR